jgi:hypothetical protein
MGKPGTAFGFPGCFARRVAVGVENDAARDVTPCSDDPVPWLETVRLLYGNRCQDAMGASMWGVYRAQWEDLESKTPYEDLLRI